MLPCVIHRAWAILQSNVPLNKMCALYTWKHLHLHLLASHSKILSRQKVKQVNYKITCLALYSSSRLVDISKRGKCLKWYVPYLFSFCCASFCIMQLSVQVTNFKLPKDFMMKLNKNISTPHEPSHLDLSIQHFMPCTSYTLKKVLTFSLAISNTIDPMV